MTDLINGVGVGFENVFPSIYARRILAWHEYILLRWFKLNRWMLMKVAGRVNSPMLYQLMNEKIPHDHCAYQTFLLDRKHAYEYLFRVIDMRRSLAFRCFRRGINDRDYFLNLLIFGEKTRVQLVKDNRAVNIIYRFLRSWSLYYRVRRLPAAGGEIWNGTDNRYFSGKRFKYIHFRTTRIDHIFFVHGPTERIRIDLLYFLMLLHPVTLGLLVSGTQVVVVDFCLLVIRDYIF
jgi:hypothetical protein